ncbi:siderophore-interacting protein [Homoserinibacter sp. YIM 151385]|uniref:siderophore-interacting protein n=1 Tax=Homoserinibacter sp. YIM 151385 TaxID=2985506 RepID=UPI0022F0B9FE|nr:siderophore-interacting protein [Homoserinibacter sp. YIM 151385]WBU37422.1 siderophore-interacting protein [Homoserinibacter sp. YIM 151385]
MSNIAVTHAPSGLVRATVLRTERVTPNMVRVTIGGDDLGRYEYQGFDQWFRLALPVDQSTSFEGMPQRFGIGGYLKYLTLPKTSRPAIRNYTVRAFRPASRELDIDFVSHGDEGIAGPWAAAVEPGAEVAFIDQGCGWAPVPSDWVLLVADESGLPAVAGILRDLPRDAVGHAIIELFDEADRQDVGAPSGVEVHWLVREAGTDPGSAALRALEALEFPAGSPYAFAVGEQALAAGARRHLVQGRGVPKQHVTFSGYWKRGVAAR